MIAAWAGFVATDALEFMICCLQLLIAGGVHRHGQLGLLQCVVGGVLLLFWGMKTELKID